MLRMRSRYCQQSGRIFKISRVAAVGGGSAAVLLCCYQPGYLLEPKEDSSYPTAWREDSRLPGNKGLPSD